jgi:hypothetical protein
VAEKAEADGERGRDGSKASVRPDSAPTAAIPVVTDTGDDAEPEAPASGEAKDESDSGPDDPDDLDGDTVVEVVPSTADETEIPDEPEDEHENEDQDETEGESAPASVDAEAHEEPPVAGAENSATGETARDGQSADAEAEEGVSGAAEEPGDDDEPDGGESVAADSPTVRVVTETRRYHRLECALVHIASGDGDVESMSRTEAKAAGYTPCTACQPDKEPEAG